MTDEKKCEHGNAHYCGRCREGKAKKCEHGNPWFCGFCYERDGEAYLSKLKATG